MQRGKTFLGEKKKQDFANGKIHCVSSMCTNLRLCASDGGDILIVLRRNVCFIWFGVLSHNLDKTITEKFFSYAGEDC